MSAPRARVLTVLIRGAVAGSLVQDPQLAFTYDADYLANPSATPLSVSMPLATGTYRQASALPWIEGLLPDSQDVRDRWGTQFRVSARNPFALLAHMGKEAPGAVQLCPPDEVEETLAQAGSLKPVTEAEIGRRLARLADNPSNWTVEGERWSLGGAQSKFALTRIGRAWHEASGAQPTTHIIKPGIGRFRSQSLNEHLIMTTAAGLGLRAARTEYQEFGGRSAIIVTRYDRIGGDDGIARVHQEDLCQALSVPPRKKYEADGGPGAARINDLLRAVADETSRWRFNEALAYNYLIGGSDAHAKNYSLLLAGHQVRLAPLYDLASSLPYDPTDDDSDLTKLAMAIGGERRFGRVTDSHWAKLAARAGIDPQRLVDRVHELARQIPDQLSDAAVTTPSTDREIGAHLLDRVVIHLKNAGLLPA